MSLRIERIARLAICSALIAALGAFACSPPQKGELERESGQRGSPGTFRGVGVSAVFEKRCGSLDCHGSKARNLRIYSSRGLRLPNDAGLTVGAGDTSQDEVTANYQSLMTLEPEQTNAVIEGKADPDTLLIVKKPLNIEHHKGGQTIRRGDDAETCIRSWLKEDVLNPVNKTACANAALFPQE